MSRPVEQMGSEWSIVFHPGVDRKSCSARKVQEIRAFRIALWPGESSQELPHEHRFARHSVPHSADVQWWHDERAPSIKFFSWIPYCLIVGLKFPTARFRADASLSVTTLGKICMALQHNLSLNGFAQGERWCDINEVDNDYKIIRDRSDVTFEFKSTGYWTRCTRNSKH